MARDEIQGALGHIAALCAAHDGISGLLDTQLSLNRVQTTVLRMLKTAEDALDKKKVDVALARVEKLVSSLPRGPVMAVDRLRRRRRV